MESNNAVFCFDIAHLLPLSLLATHTLNKLSVIATQNQNSAERFIKLGANKDKVMVAGNIKFEQNPSANKNQTKAIKESPNNIS
jgi:3-deoxy-D-manno-octulosonic-acid transferase